MTIKNQPDDWIKISRTMLPGLTVGSRLKIDDVSEKQFVVSYQPVRRTSLIFALLPKLEPQKLELNISECFCSAQNSSETAKSVPLKISSRFDVINEGCGEDDGSRLLLIDDIEQFTIAGEPELTVADLQWLKVRMNEWLGWEFPSHCYRCGHALSTKDLDWPQRRVRCTECDFTGRAPEPFESDSIPLSPPLKCPSCHSSICMRDVNRVTGGCRCLDCGWVSEAIPSLRFDGQLSLGTICQSLMEVAIAGAMHNSEHIFGEAEIKNEYPRYRDALKQLADEELVQDDTDLSSTVLFTRWKTSCVKVTAILTGMSLVVLTVALATILNRPEEGRGLGEYLALRCCQLAWVGIASLLTAVVLWGRKQVSLTFLREGLDWRIGNSQRWISWRTLAAVTAAKGGWVPMLIVKHGGAGVPLVTPSHASARALTRLCLHFRDNINPGSSPHVE